MRLTFLPQCATVLARLTLASLKYFIEILFLFRHAGRGLNPFDVRPSRSRLSGRLLLQDAVLGGQSCIFLLRKSQAEGDHEVVTKAD